MPLQHGVPLTPEQIRQANVQLPTRFRNRLIAELALRDVDPKHYAAHLSKITGRAVQTAARWIDPDKPGLPDLHSLTTLCLLFEVDANWLLGLSSARICLNKAALPASLQTHPPLHEDTDFDWLAEVVRLAMLPDWCQAAQMEGNDMAPLITHGAPFFIDTSVDHISSNGLYALRYRGQILVRHAELRIGEGVLLRCQNPKNTPILLKESDTASASAVVVLGRVAMAVNVLRF